MFGTPVHMPETLTSSILEKYCYRKGVQNCVLYLEVVPFLGGSFIGGFYCSNHCLLTVNAGKKTGDVKEVKTVQEAKIKPAPPGKTENSYLAMPELNSYYFCFLIRSIYCS